MNSTFNLFGVSLILASAVLWQVDNLDSKNRKPAEALAPIHLQIQKLDLSQLSLLRDVDGAILRATFNAKERFEFKSLKLNAQQTVENLDLKVRVEDQWLHNNNLDISIEIVKKGIIDSVLMRCAQVSKNVREYNRVYQCSLPGTQHVVLTYRLFQEDGRTSIPVAQN